MGFRGLGLYRASRVVVGWRVQPLGLMCRHTRFGSAQEGLRLEGVVDNDDCGRRIRVSQLSSTALPNRTYLPEACIRSFWWQAGPPPHSSHTLRKLAPPHRMPLRLFRSLPPALFRLFAQLAQAILPARLRHPVHCALSFDFILGSHVRRI